MKILVLGDFHGQFPNGFNKIIKNNKIYLVLSSGDYFSFYS